MREYVTRVTQGVYDALLAPERLVSVSESHYGGTYAERLERAWELLVVYAVNLALYAGPLTLAGFGQSGVPAPAEWVPRSVLGLPGSVVWSYGYGFVQNSLFIFAATVLTLVTYHVGVTVTFQSRGFLRSAYAVIYSTSVYLAGIFTLVWYLSMSARLEHARTFVLDVQRAFIYAVIDALGAGVDLPGGRPGTLSLEAVSTTGSVVLSLLLVLLAYYLYSLYLGSRINHRAGRLGSLAVVGAVLVSPVIYVAGSVFATTLGGL